MTDTDANKGSGYKACGCGMGPALNIGASSGAYVLDDRGTWRNFKNRADPTVLEEGDKRLFNPYGVMLVSAAKHAQVKTAEGQKFVDWVTGSAGQAVITSYKIGGERFFSERGEVGWGRQVSFDLLQSIAITTSTTAVQRLLPVVHSLSEDRCRPGAVFAQRLQSDCMQGRHDCRFPLDREEQWI